LAEPVEEITQRIACLGVERKAAGHEGAYVDARHWLRPLLVDERLQPGRFAPLDRCPVAPELVPEVQIESVIFGRHEHGRFGNKVVRYLPEGHRRIQRKGKSAISRRKACDA
jgi:hypothetical protein